MKYKIIYADPPWSYRDKALAGNRGARCKYDVMETAEISRMDVGGGGGQRLYFIYVGDNAKIGRVF